MLIWIVLRVRTSPNIDDADEANGADDGQCAARYTESRPQHPNDSDEQ
jgi:hypothetical protein